MSESVCSVRAIEIEMADPERAAAFYADVWHLTEVARQDGAIYLRGTSALHHILAIHKSRGPAAVRRVVFDAADRACVDALHGKVAATGLALEEAGPLESVGGGYGFGFEDGVGRAFAIICDGDDHGDDDKVPDRPCQIGHVNLNDPGPDATRGFFEDVLGFRCVDHSGPQYFMHCDNTDHSSIVICRAEAATLNHVAFEMMDLDSVMRGTGRMIDAGYPIEWGVGRHGPGDNSFAYFAGPEEFPLEYTADIAQIDDTYAFHGPDYWKWPPGRLDQWGVTPPHTKRWKRVQGLYGFARDAYRLHGKAGTP